MTTLHSKKIHFKIENNPHINKIMKNGGTLFVEATIHFEESDEFDSTYYGYYDMQWSPLFSKEKPYTITTILRSKILAILSGSCYNESQAFMLNEGIVYDLSEIEIRTIRSIIG